MSAESRAAHAPLSSLEAGWVPLVFAAIFPEPPRGDGEVAITSLGPASFYARLCRTSRFDHALTLRAALWIVAVVAPVVVLRRFPAFGSLSVADREALLVGMASSPIYLFRQIVFLLKAQAAQLYAAHPAVAKRVTSPPARDALVPLRKGEKRVEKQGDRHDDAA
ncbi:MAG: hypothetical protein JNM74_11195 [Myxococcales bacterium]|nr:hypothetical protein [Myxococcales bacterium]